MYVVSQDTGLSLVPRFLSFFRHNASFSSPKNGGKPANEAVLMYIGGHLMAVWL